MKNRKKIVALLFCVAALSLLGGCGTKVVHCDRCGAELKVPKNSNMDEEWLIFCDACEKETGLDQLPELFED